MRLLFVLLLVLLTRSMGVAQQQNLTGVPKDWFLRDPETDHLQGVSADKVYSLLTGKPSTTVIVAVIDSGVDIEHEDLKDVIWTNKAEIAGNGIDDDRNGYIDDLHGWNFIGGKNGNVKDDSNEVTREYKRLKEKYGTLDEKQGLKKNKVEYTYWKKVKEKYERDSKFNNEQYVQFKEQYDAYTNIFGTVSFCDSLLKQHLKITSISKSSLDNFVPLNDTLSYAKGTLQRVYENLEEDMDLNAFILELQDYLEYLKEGVDHFEVGELYGYNLDYDSRKIVGDEYTNINEKFYGNNDVTGPDAFHGTHVAGIIGANRHNDLGIKGIADNVKIMSVRVVPPSGDERDKDVANAIFYAVNNGARIINMSFGKSFSPNKDVVDKAVKYAESKGVLLIHAAGNDGDNNDTDENFPNRYYKDGTEAKNWIEIGASSWGTDSDFVASFSNYGKKSVDLFAPGVKIYSTAPNNDYRDADGTSMASPTTAGVAAILLSYFPELTAVQTREILRQSTRKFDNLKVKKPGTEVNVDFNQLSSSGGLVNAYEAVKLALKMKATRVEK
ncbi:MAG: S8 family peptidase [Cyclobacteriaceae bacterium]|nr:S8 family peptidase [Cyclobacteriaceae bacterium]